MRLSISNIAWRAEEEAAVAKLLQARGITGVEIAPGRIAPPGLTAARTGVAPSELTDDEVLRYRSFWGDHNIEVVAMQALLFGQPDLQVFGDASDRRALVRYLTRIVAIGGLAGAKALVFGSPKNRRVDGLTANEIEARSREVFRELGAIAVDHGTCLCIEPNPPEYGCNWITSAAEAKALVDRIDHPGFGLHLDAAALHLANEDAALLRSMASEARHFHVSEPELAPVGAPTSPVPHASFAAALGDARYANWISIEMRQPAPDASNLPALTAALDFTATTYAVMLG
ncbi:MAG: sugar phosphate isomerase/epimerase [Planctomycetota bacterium]